MGISKNPCFSIFEWFSAPRAGSPRRSRGSRWMPGHAVRLPWEILFPLMVAANPGLPAAPAQWALAPRLRGRCGPQSRCGSTKKRLQGKPVYPATAFCKETPCFLVHLWRAAQLLRPSSAHAFSFGLPHGSAKAARDVPVWHNRAASRYKV